MNDPLAIGLHHNYLIRRMHAIVVENFVPMKLGPGGSYSVVKDLCGSKTADMKSSFLFDGIVDLE